ncbi:MAG: sialidase family protein [Bacteroidaceae bacterium]
MMIHLNHTICRVAMVCLLTAPSFFAMAQTDLAAVPRERNQILFHTGDEYKVPYRIPAIATAKNGDIMALSDRRFCGSDIGYGHVDIVGRVSRDNGKTWGKDFIVLRGGGTGRETGYGDACLVADRESNRMLLVCVAGNVSYWNSTIENPQAIVRSYGTYDKATKSWKWSKPVDFTDHIYKELLGNRVKGLFMGSGRICQSRKVKVGKYNRIYAALATHVGNFALYSDNFGETWAVLGSAEISCAPKGDEPKCEELPDGSVVLSSRKQGGRWFNIYKYTNVKTAAGTWGTPCDSKTAKGGICNEGSPTDGEILLTTVRNTQTGQKVTLALQSIPAGPQRKNVTIYYKELSKVTDYDTPIHFSENWLGSYQVSYRGSGYSTMIQQKDGRIGFYFEEEPTNYQMVYLPLTIGEITKGTYK